jgi:small subunit ribosomal protein S10
MQKGGGSPPKGVSLPKPCQLKPVYHEAKALGSIQLKRYLMPEVYFKISIKSFEHSALQPAKEKIEELSLLVDSRGHHLVMPASTQLPCSACEARAAPDAPKRRKVGSSISLPSSKKRFTVLKSPHIDKKSREQFQLQTHKAKIETACYSKDKACLLLLLLKNSELMGVEVKLAISYSTPFCP